MLGKWTECDTIHLNLHVTYNIDHSFWLYIGEPNFSSSIGTSLNVVDSRETHHILTFNLFLHFFE